MQSEIPFIKYSKLVVVVLLGVLKITEQEKKQYQKHIRSLGKNYQGDLNASLMNE